MGPTPDGSGPTPDSSFIDDWGCRWAWCGCSGTWEWHMTHMPTRRTPDRRKQPPPVEDWHGIAKRWEGKP